MKQQSGSALVAALCFIFGASLLTMAVLAMSKYNTFTVRPHIEMQRSFYISEGAANRIQWLLAADRQLHSVTNPGREAYEDYEYDRYIADGVLHSLDYYGTPVEFTITDANSGIDFSSRSWRNTLRSFKLAYDTDTDFTEQIDLLEDLLADYTDSNDTITGDGKELAEYEAENKRPLPRNGAMQFREELFYIDGFTAIFPPDKYGILSSIRLIPPDNMAVLNGRPNVFTADKFTLMTYCDFEEEEAETVLEALRIFQRDRINLEDQLDIDLLPRLQTMLSWQESGYYTVNIRPPAGKIGKRLTFSFQGFGVSGPSNERVRYLQWLFY